MNLLSLDDYLRGNGTPSQRNEWQQMIATDDTIRTQALFSRRLRLAVQYSEPLAFAQAVSIAAALPIPALLAPTTAATGKAISIVKTILLLSAVATALLLIGRFAANRIAQRTAQTQATAARIADSLRRQQNALNLLTHYPNTLALPPQHALTGAMTAYDAHNYASAANLLQTYLIAHPFDKNATLYLALSFLYLKDYSKAVALLEKIKARTDTTLLPDIEWHLAIAYTLNGQQEKALILLHSLQTNPIYKDRATSLLQ